MSVVDRALLDLARELAQQIYPGLLSWAHRWRRRRGRDGDHPLDDLHAF